MTSPARQLEKRSRSLFGISVRAMAHLESTVSASQLRALLVLEEQPALSLHELATALGTGDGAASRLVDRLVQAGLVDRQPRPDDRRTVALRLTSAGGEVLEELGRSRSQAFAGVLSAMSEHDVTALLQGLAGFTVAARP